MKNVIIFGGTTEGRRLVELLEDSGLQLHLFVTTDYGASLIPKNENVQVMTGKLDCKDMEQAFLQIKPDLCIDGTHPYAMEVTKNLNFVCEKLEVPYIRLVREADKQPDTKNVDGKDVWFVETVSEAVSFLSETEGTIFITTGSNELEEYTKIPGYQERCVARVLSIPEVVDKCSAIGFRGKNLIAMQGPFSREMNRLMFRTCDARWLVTKSSGAIGGYIEKCEAARDNGMKLVVIGRPCECEENAMGLSELLDWLVARYGVILKKPVVYLVSMGPGDSRLLTEEARDILHQADVLIGAKRVLDIWKEMGNVPRFVSYKKEEILKFINKNPQYHTIVICYSGDIGFYSGARGLQDALKGYEVHSISGVSSVVYFLNKINKPWDCVKLVSCHGRDTDMVSVMDHHKRACVLLGEENSLIKICETLRQEDGEKVYQVILGSQLTYENERIEEGTLDDFLEKKVDRLSIAYLEKKDEEISI